MRAKANWRGNKENESQESAKKCCKNGGDERKGIKSAFGPRRWNMKREKSKGGGKEGDAATRDPKIFESRRA